MLLLLLVGTAAFRPDVSPEQRNAILISWDGALREDVQADVASGKLPNLARLISQGHMVDIDVVGHVTDTKSGHAQILTGYDPEVSGVHSNKQYKPIPAGLSIFGRLRAAFGKAVTTIMLTGKDHNLGSQGPGLLSSADPYYLVRPEITVWDGDQNRPANVVGEKAVRYVQRYAGAGRFFLFIHFPDVDVAGHKYGEGSGEYDAALRECDRWLGKILDEVKGQGIEDRTLLYVTADHGFDPGAKQHHEARHIFLATNDPKVARGGQQRDIAPTVLAGMGVDLSKVHPRLAGKPLASPIGQAP